MVTLMMVAMLLLLVMVVVVTMMVNSYLELFTCNSSQQPHESVTVLILTVQVGKLRLRRVIDAGQAYTAGESHTANWSV